MPDKSLSEIDTLATQFFSLFTNKGGAVPPVEKIHQLCIPAAIIIKNSGTCPEVYSLEEFVKPRKKILTDGTLIDFSEWETDSKTQIAGRIAQRLSLYKKSGIINGVSFEMRGIKTIQFIYTTDGWKINSLAWDDERDGFTLPDSL